MSRHVKIKEKKQQNLRSVIQKKRKPLCNKKGQIESMLLAVVLIVVIGIILLFFNHVNDKLYGALDKYFNESTDYNDSEAQHVLRDIQEVDNSVWDYGFLAIFIGVMLQMVVFSFATRVNVAFFWVFAFIGIIILVIGVILAATWQELAENEEFAGTILRFPITNTLLGSYFPTAIVAVFFISIIVLFGKPPTERVG